MTWVIIGGFGIGFVIVTIWLSVKNGRLKAEKEQLEATLEIRKKQDAVDNQPDADDDTLIKCMQDGDL